MKKIFTLATAALLLTGSAFANCGDKDKKCTKDCCKKEAKAKKETAKTAAKDDKAAVKATKKS